MALCPPLSMQMHPHPPSLSPLKHLPTQPLNISPRSPYLPTQPLSPHAAIFFFTHAARAGTYPPTSMLASSFAPGPASCTAFFYGCVPNQFTERAHVLRRVLSVVSGLIWFLSLLSISSLCVLKLSCTVTRSSCQIASTRDTALRCLPPPTQRNASQRGVRGWRV